MDAIETILTNTIKRNIKEGKITRASVWVRDLETKQYSSVNELDTYEPASLLKLPLAVVYYKYSEISPGIMDAMLTYTTPTEMDEKYNFFTATTTLSVGSKYAVRDLLERMLKTSDNGAYFTLLHNVDADFYGRVMLDLGIQIPSDNKILDFVTVKTYANIFRSLYNASYLNRQDSQELLAHMTESDFKGIAEPLPADVQVSHKFGERGFYDQNGKLVSSELHDCGIIYRNSGPYTLCIMTAGSDFKTLHSVIEELSKLTNENI